MARALPLSHNHWNYWNRWLTPSPKLLVSSRTHTFISWEEEKGFFSLPHFRRSLVCMLWWSSRCDGWGYFSPSPHPSEKKEYVYSPRDYGHLPVSTEIRDHLYALIHVATSLSCKVSQLVPAKNSYVGIILLVPVAISWYRNKMSHWRNCWTHNKLIVQEWKVSFRTPGIAGLNGPQQCEQLLVSSTTKILLRVKEDRLFFMM